MKKKVAMVIPLHGAKDVYTRAKFKKAVEALRVAEAVAQKKAAQKAKTEKAQEFQRILKCLEFHAKRVRAEAGVKGTPGDLEVERRVRLLTARYMVMHEEEQAVVFEKLFGTKPPRLK